MLRRCEYDSERTVVSVIHWGTVQGPELSLSPSGISR